MYLTERKTVTYLFHDRSLLASI